MKKIISIIFLCSFFYSCNNNTVKPPLTIEPVLMGSVSEDQVNSSDNSVTKSGYLGSGQLNFLDRDSTIINFYYKGSPGNTAVYQLEILDSTGNGMNSIYTFRDITISETLKYKSVTLASRQAFAYYVYRIRCSGASDQFFYVKDLSLYKK